MEKRILIVLLFCSGISCGVADSNKDMQRLPIRDFKLIDQSAPAIRFQVFSYFPSSCYKSYTKEVLSTDKGFEISLFSEPKGQVCLTYVTPLTEDVEVYVQAGRTYQFKFRSYESSVDTTITIPVND